MEKICIVSSEEYHNMAKDCYYQKFMKQYYELQQKIHIKNGEEKRILRGYLEQLTPKAIKIIEAATCYPDQCKHCPGMTKCRNCTKQEICYIDMQLPMNA